MRKLATLLTIAATLALVGSATAITVDGVIDAGEWDGYICTDSTSDLTPTNTASMARWGAKSDGTNIYFFMELAGSMTWADYISGGDVWPGLYMDVDNDRTTYCGYKNTANIADYKTEVGPAGALWVTTGLTGADLAFEFNTDETTYVNWWGGMDSSYPAPNFKDMQGECYGNSYAYSGLVMEIAIPIDGGGNLGYNEAVAGARTSPLTPLTPSDYIVVGSIVQGDIDGVITSGNDMGCPTAIAIDPTNKPLLGGDATLDGAVTAGDLAILAASYGASYPASWMMGDFNRDAAVTAGDLAILAANYGSSAAPPAATPEPATLGLLALGVLGLLRRR
ncbi:MAG: PEP-CTERM sorting domain-containing protein [Phycisphaerae bacterium]|nr:PEP-CTERM sorting domain-containing protein [Phycisphaerae bacterium]